VRSLRRGGDPKINTSLQDLTSVPRNALNAEWKTASTSRVKRQPQCSPAARGVRRSPSWRRETSTGGRVRPRTCGHLHRRERACLVYPRLRQCQGPSHLQSRRTNLNVKRHSGNLTRWAAARHSETRPSCRKRASCGDGRCNLCSGQREAQSRRPRTTLAACLHPAMSTFR
jgi:hypothetical protein